VKASSESKSEISEREILYKVLFDMKKDMGDMKKLILDLLQSGGGDHHFKENNAQFISRLYQDVHQDAQPVQASFQQVAPVHAEPYYPPVTEHEELEEQSLSLEDQEKDLIIKALEKYRGRRKQAAMELGISERTLYRKIKEYGINL
jgi:DNA-binding NtrC family response regulator